MARHNDEYCTNGCLNKNGKRSIHRPERCKKRRRDLIDQMGPALEGVPLFSKTDFQKRYKVVRAEEMLMHIEMDLCRSWKFNHDLSQFLEIILLPQIRPLIPIHHWVQLRP
jgi:hypothetical protein